MMHVLVFVVFLATSSYAQAAIDCADPNVVALRAAVPADPETISYTTPAGSNQILFVGVGQRNGVTPRTHTQTHAGNALTSVTSEQYTDPAGAQLYYIVNPTSGTNNVVIDWNSAPLADGIIIFTCSGVDTASPIRSFSGATATSTLISTTPASVQSGDVVVDFFLQNGTDAATVGANQTVITNGNDGSESTSGASFQAGADGAAMTWSIVSHSWAQIAAVLKPAATASTRRAAPMVFQ